jgi:hypothetical protein
MDKQERGLLLADQEELEKKIASIKKQLFDMGNIWQNLSGAMTSKPEKIIFANAPEEFSAVPMNLLGVPSFNWRDIPKIELIAELIQNLRAEIDHLNDVQVKLRF